MLVVWGDHIHYYLTMHRLASNVITLTMIYNVSVLVTVQMYFLHEDILNMDLTMTQSQPNHLCQLLATGRICFM